MHTMERNIPKVSGCQVCIITLSPPELLEEKGLCQG